MEDFVAVLLHHAGMGIETGIAKFGDLLCQKFHAVCGVAEDDGLVDLELGEEGVQAVDFLLLFDEGVVLGDSAESEFVHEIDLVGISHMLIFELFDNHWEGCAEQHDLSIFGVEVEELLDDDSKFWREELICFIHDEDGAFGKVSNTFAGKVEYAAWGANNDVDSVAKSNDVVFEASASGCNHDIYAEVFPEGFAYLRGLKS